MAGYGFNIGLDGRNAQPLTDKDAEEIAGGLAEIYSQARQTMLKNVAGRVARGVTRYGWAERKASEVLDAHRQLEKIYDRASVQREKLLEHTIERAMLTGNQKFYKDMGSILGNVAHISPNAMKAGYILNDLNNTLGAAERRILRQFNDKYADVIATASAKMATGVTNTRQAVGEALTAFADEGIDCFVDRGGNHWTIENYSEMAVLTAIERATISGYADTMESYGYDLAIIDGHAGSCPICAAWEGVIISISGDNPDYPSLGDAENDGCFHPRCVHGITTYYPGISHEPKGGFRNEPREIQDPGPQYTARSRQRYMERQIRKYKDRAIVAMTSQQLMMAKNKVRQWENALDQLIEDQPDDNYMYRQKGREKARTSLLQTNGNSGKINTASINNPIEQRNTGKGVPSAIVHMNRPLNNRQTTLLEQLPEFGSRVSVSKHSVSMKDLSAMTASTGDEFAMFTKKGERLIVRGNATQTPINTDDAKKLNAEGFRWSGHTHPGTDRNCLQASEGDIKVLDAFDQDMSVIYNSLGEYQQFGR